MAGARLGERLTVDQEVAGSNPVGHLMETKMKFIRIGSMIINISLIRKIAHKEGDYNTSQTCAIYYTDGNWDEVAMNEAEFQALLARLDNFHLLIS